MNRKGSIVVRVPASRLRAIEALLGREEAQAAARRGLLSAALRGRANAVDETAKAGKVDTGRFRNSWKAEAFPEGATLTNDAPYAAVVEGGRRPGGRLPPFGPIEAWARRKGIDASVGTVNAIRYAIVKRGIKPTWILRGITKKRLPRYIDDEVRREVLRVFQAALFGPVRRSR